MEGNPEGLPPIVASAELETTRPAAEVGNYRRAQKSPASRSGRSPHHANRKGQAKKFSSPEPLHKSAQQHDVISERKNRGMQLALPNLPPSARIVEGEFPGNFVLLHPTVPKTPQTLYRSQFQPGGKEKRMSNDGRESPGREEPVPRKIFGNDGGITARRPCQEVEMRMPLCYSQGEHSLTLDVLSQLVGRESTILKSTDLMRPIVGIALNEKPTSRLQAQMLASWFGSQISCLANRGAGMPPPPLVVDGELVHAPVAEVLPDIASLSKLGTEEAEMLMALWDLENLGRVPFVIGHPIGQQIRVEGVKVPNDRRYLQAMLQVCGTAAAAVTQQVAMHCHERGKLLSSVWNLSVGLMEFEAESLRKQIDTVTEETLNRKYMAASKEEVRAAKYKIKELEAKNRESERTNEVLRKHNMDMKKELDDLKGVGQDTVVKQQYKIEKLEWETAHAKEEAQQCETQLDITFTCFHAATQQAKKLRDHVTELEDRLWQATAEEDEEGKGWTGDLKDSMSVSLKNLRGEAEDISDLEGYLEKEIRSSGRRMSKSAYNPYHALDRLMKVKTQNLLPVAVLQEYRSSESLPPAAAPTGEISLAGSLAAEQSAQSVHSSKTAADAVQEKAEETKKALTDLASEALAADPDTVLEQADMDDADEMKRDEMWDEIKRLREKENVLLILIKSMQEQYEKIAAVEARLKRAISHINKGQVDQAATLISDVNQDIAPAPDGENADGSNEPPGEGDGANGAGEGAPGDAVPPYLENTGFSSVTSFLSKLATAVMKVNTEETQAQETKKKKKAEKLKKTDSKSADAAAATIEEARFEALKSWTAYNSITVDESAAGDGVKLPPSGDLFRGLFKVLSLSGDAISSDAAAAAAAAHAKSLEEAAALAASQSTLPRTQTPLGGSNLNPAKSKDIPSNTTANVHVAIQEQEAAGPKPGTPGKHGTPTSVTRARNMLNKNQSIRRIAKAVGKVAAATATPAPTFFCKNQMLKDAMQINANTGPRSTEWALKVIEGTYKRIGVQEAKSTKDIFEATSIPEALMAHFGSQYGAKKIVQEYVAGMVATLRNFRSTHPPLNIFNKFLSEDWNNLILAYSLEASNLASAKGSLPIPCVEYPDPKNRGTRYICTRKALAICEQVLGGRSVEATEKFKEQLEARSDVGLTGNDMSYFWSPAQGDTFEAEVARNGPMAKILFHDFMMLLCTEAQRLETNMLDLLPQLFREMDKNHNGHLTRREFDSMLDACFNDIPDTAFRLERLKTEKDIIWGLAESFTTMERQGPDDIDDEGRNDISFKGFMHAVERSDLFRIYMRFRRCEAAPDEVDTNTAHSKDKSLYLCLQRSWESFSNCWEYLKGNSQIAASAHHIIGLEAKMPNEVCGEKKAAMHIKLLQELLEHKLNEIKSLAKKTSSHSEIHTMETLLQKMQQSVKVAYGYQALLEDDIDTFSIMLDRDAPLGMRRRASSHWRQQVAFLTSYRRDAEAHATAIVNRQLTHKFGKKLLDLRKKFGAGGNGKSRPGSSSVPASLGALMEHVKRGDPAEVRRMLSNNEADVNAADYDARTALHVAALAGSLGMVKALCDCGANVNAIDNWNGSPIDDAIRNGHLSTANDLAARGGKVGNQENAGIELMKAVTKGDAEKASLLLTAGASPDTHDYDNRYALHIAIAKSPIEVVSLLIEAGASLDVKDNFGYTPLDEATRHATLLDDQTVVNMLLSHGATRAK